MSNQREEWQPQIEKCLRKADCGAQVAKYSSGHPMWRVPEENISLLPDVADEKLWESDDSVGSGHGIPIDAEFFQGMYELIKPLNRCWAESMLGEWKDL